MAKKIVNPLIAKKVVKKATDKKVVEKKETKVKEEVNETKVKEEVNETKVMTLEEIQVALQEKDAQIEALQKSISDMSGEKVKSLGVDESKITLPASEMTEYLNRIERTREKLMSGPMTSFVLPLEPGEKAGAFETVNINGFKLTIKKGALVEIPVPVMMLLANYKTIEVGAGADMRADRDYVKDGVSIQDAI